MAKNDNKNFSLPTIKDLEIYFDLIKKKDISELEIETDQIRIKIVSENKNIKFSTKQTASEIINHSQSTELTIHKDTYMFVTPQFIEQYSSDLVDGMNDPDFEALTKKFQEFLNPPATTTTTGGTTTP